MNTNSRACAAIVFDFDGTLIDATADLTTAVNEMRSGLGLAPLSLAEVKSYVGEGARKLVRRSLPAEIEGRAFEDAFAAFYRQYERVCTATTQAYAGVPELLLHLSEAHPAVPLALCTNKPERMTRLILEHLGLSRYLTPVVGGDSLATRKPEPHGLMHIAAEHNLAVTQLLLVGDTTIDARTADAAGCELALIEWGYGEPEVLRAEQAAIRANEVSELQEKLSRWAAERRG